MSRRQPYHERDLTHCIETKNVTLKSDNALPYGLKGGGYVQISIADCGSGMDKETMGKIFDPFFTTKELAGGTGLGLASVYTAIKAAMDKK
ncbi:MAG TPA: hypothetical protein HPP59_08235 [Deltaproteobacteria bacterium]|nr:hypothetical protein [Deltaproteobacteria bacterium]